MAYNYDDSVYTKILRRLRAPLGVGYGRTQLFSSANTTPSSVGLGVQEDTSGSAVRFMAEGGEVTGYTERWKKARGKS